MATKTTATTPSQDEGPSERSDEGSDERPDQRPDETKEALPDVEQEAAIPAAVSVLGYVENVVYYGIAIVLVLLAIGALAKTAADFLTHDDPFAPRMTAVVNGVLFVVIILELLRTVLAHFQDSTFHLKPFLIIGIISVVRHILTVGAELSLSTETGTDLFRRSDVELGVNALVVVALVVGLVLVRKTE